MIENALVIGGGIGGLAVATALAKRGVAVTLYEQASAITEVGAGLQISPNGLAVLRALGVEAALDRGGAVQAEAVVLRDFLAGRTVARLDLRRLAGQRYLFVHRADLVSALLDAAQAAGVVVELAQTAVKLRPGKTPEVLFDDGELREASLVVCADGLHSIGRQAIDGPSEARFTGQVAWRAMVPAEGIDPVATVSMGPGRHVVSYPLRGGRLLNLVAVEERDIWAEEGWHHQADPDRLRHSFSDFGGAVGEALRRVETVHLWGLFRHPVADTWQKGNAVLLGDAAHPTLPFMAQGANMALEDALVLADVIAQGEPLVGYQERRKGRTRRIVEAASRNAWKYHLRQGPIRWAAHRALGLGSALAPDLMLRQFDWLYRYDVTRADQK